MAEEYYYKEGVCYDSVKQSEKIFLLYTYKCNAACEHCLTESDPSKTEKLTLDAVKTLLEKGTRYGKNWLMISGGEPLMYRREIEAIYTEATKLGYYCCLGSNAFWAKSPEIAYERLSRLRDAGLQALFPSATAFHAEYVPTERVAYAAEACAKLGLVCEINFYPSLDPEKDNKIIGMLGLDEQPFYTDGLILSGRDVSHLEPVFEERRPDALDDCGSIHLAITPRGDAIANCNITYRYDEFKGSVFDLGNIFDDGADAVFQREAEDPVLQYLMAEQKNVIDDVLRNDPIVGQEYVSTFGQKTYHSATEFYLDALAEQRFRDALTRAAISYRETNAPDSNALALGR
ncbi:radical SAM protein [Parerythrobacter aestuarii]|uniref:radical SAM protein n=1 Tax=Parerythrobacter aestuarii TaxID=3020909 RepID=UPI0024DE955B|nr:radical SAM protein [Parerythrobacter aestuarii]